MTLFQQISHRLRALILGILITIFLPSGAWAVNSPCKGDSFKFEGDKQAHLIYSTGIGVASRSVVKSPELAFALALAPGLYREMYRGNCFSFEDMVYNAAGALIGVYTTHWVLTPGRVVYNIDF